MSIEAKIESLVAAIEKQTQAMTESSAVLARLLGESVETPKKTKKTKTETAVAEAPVAEAPVVAVPPREVSAEALRAEAIKLIGQLKTKLDENKYAEFTTKLKTVLYPSFKTVNGAVKCLDDTNVMDDFGRGEFLTAIEKLVAEYVG